MPRVTGAEKQRRYREKLKGVHGADAMKERDAARKREARQKDVVETRAKEVARQRRCRASKKARAQVDHRAVGELSVSSSSPLASYSTTYSLNRAVKRVSAALPPSPSKRRKVRHELNNSLGDTSFGESHSVPAETSPAPHRTLEEVCKRVKDFYLRPDVSWTAPGRKDSIMVERDGKKTMEQRHYLMMSLAEAYALYKEEFPEDRIKVSKFKSLRPDNVLFQSKMPHNVCVCVYHENINLMLRALISKRVSFPANHRELLSFIHSNHHCEECHDEKCMECRQHTTAEFLCSQSQATDEQLAESVSWYQWVTSEEGTNKIERVGTVHDVLEKLSGKLQAFCVHSYTKQVQAEAFKNMCSVSEVGHAVLQIDFSENAALISQDEVQNAHWTHQQVSLFTAVAWMGEQSYSYCVVSNSLSHDKYSAAPFIEAIIDDLKMKAEVTHIEIYSDGAAQHFKQKYMFAFLTSLLERKEIKGNWNFFDTSHGKGAVDGIGGTVKQMIFRAVKSRTMNPTNSQEYAKCAQHLISKTKILYVSAAAVEEKRELFDSLWEKARPVPNTHAVHCVRTESFGVVTIAKNTSCVGTVFNLILTNDRPSKPPVASEPDPQVASEPDPQVASASDLPAAVPTIQSGMWYAVHWEETDHWFIGQAVCAVSVGVWKFYFLQQTNPMANCFKRATDVADVGMHCVFTEVEAPAPASSEQSRSS